MENLRRSSRKTNQIDYRDIITPSYPESAPQNKFEECIAQLNNETFQSSSFSIVDDALVYSLFSSKRRTSGYRTMIPDRAFKEEGSLISKEQGVAIRHIYKYCVGEQREGKEERKRAGCDCMTMTLPVFFSRDSFPTLRQ